MTRVKPTCYHPTTKRVGLNQNPPDYYISALPFADLAKQGLDWLLPTSSGGIMAPPTMAPVNSVGWPLVPAMSQIMAGGYQRPERDGVLPADRMILHFNLGSSLAATDSDVVLTGVGVSLVCCSVDATTRVATREYKVTSSDASGAMSILVNAVNDYDADLGGNGDGQGGESLDLGIELWTDPAHEAAHDADPKKIFFDQFLTRFKDLNPSVVRTQEWCRTQGSSGTLLNNADSRSYWDPIAQPRTAISDPRWSVPTGVPYEAHAWLANELNCDLWVDIPFIYYGANDTATQAAAKAYIQEMATVLRDELDLSHHCIVEFSNETWNANFTTYKVLDQNEPGGATPQNLIRFFDDAYGWWWEVWNDCRVEFTVMGHNGDISWATTIANGLVANNYVDAVGCTLYYFPKASDVTAWATAGGGCGINYDDFIPPSDDAIRISTEAVIDNDDPNLFRALTDVIRNHGDLALALTAARSDPTDAVRFYLYEGGPSYLTGCSNLKQTFTDFNHLSSYTKDILKHAMDRFIDGVGVGGLNPPLTKLVDRFVYFAFCQDQDTVNGDFLATTDLWAGTGGAITDPQTQYRFDAMKEFNDAH